MSERRIDFMPAFDDEFGCKHKRKGNHGRGSAEMRWVSVIDNNAAVWVVYTGWHLPETYEKGHDINGSRLTQLRLASEWPPTGVIDLHASAPQFSDHEPRTTCPYINGPCYFDAAYSASDELAELLVREGHEGVWKRLDAWAESLAGVAA